MTDKEFMAKVRSLPARQQIGLWVILKNFHQKKGTWFTAPEFAEKMRKFLISDDTDNLARIMGGILSSLLRNGMIEQLSGGRKPVWQVVSELHRHAKEYEEAMFPVITYWGK